MIGAFERRSVMTPETDQTAAEEQGLHRNSHRGPDKDIVEQPGGVATHEIEPHLPTLGLESAEGTDQGAAEGQQADWGFEGRGKGGDRDQQEENQHFAVGGAYGGQISYADQQHQRARSRAVEQKEVHAVKGRRDKEAEQDIASRLELNRRQAEGECDSGQYLGKGETAHLQYGLWV